MRTVDDIEINGEKLASILVAHAEWLEDSETGIRASLSGADLSGANLSRADLSRADLHSADLSGANLSRADLSRADLSGASLSGAHLSCADLSRADGIMSFGPIGRDGRIGYAVLHADVVMYQLGCHWGNLVDTCAAIVRKHGADSLYEKQVRLASEILEENR